MLFYKKSAVFPLLSLLFLLIGGMSGCELTEPGPSDTLKACADALQKNDSSLFLEQFDTRACAVSEIRNMTEANEALSTLDQLGKTLGLGGMDDLIGNVFDMESALRQRLGRKASTGELALECQRSEKPGCPWVAQSLRTAEIKKVSENAAVARVTTPTRMTTWLALARKVKSKSWRIVGWALLEEQARAFALRDQKEAGKTAQEEKKEEKKKEKEKKPASGAIEL